MRRVIATILSISCLMGLSACGQPNEENHKSSSVVIEEVALTDVPEAVFDTVEDYLTKSGAHCFSFQDDYYVLLTAGNVAGLNMVVSYDADDDMADFSVTMSDSKNTTEEVLYRLYKTNTKNINVNDVVLKNPYLRIGAEGINAGYFTKKDDGYLVVPIQDTSIQNQLYLPGESIKEDLKAGLYEFEYKIASDGSYQILSANPVSQLSQFGTIKAIDKSGTITVEFGTNETVMTLQYDTGNTALTEKLPSSLDSGELTSGMLTFGYINDRLMLTDFGF